MYLSHLLQGIIPVSDKADRDILSLTLDSRKVKTGALFIAIPGTQYDGRQYISEAITNGAIAVLIDDISSEAITWQAHVPLIPVSQLKAKMGYMASRFYDDPSKKLRVIGVTGTSGKTSCTQFIAQVLQSQLQIPCGTIGTLGSGLYGSLNAPSLTTPDALTLQSTLHTFVEQGVHAVTMEVSSHSIDQGRINGIDFDIGIFTNLTQDHLDYHHDMETYAAVKKRFIAESPIKHIIINADDFYGKKWIAELSLHKSVIAFGTSKPSHIKNVPTVYASRVELTLKGIKAHVYTPWGEGELLLPLIGEFNLSNGLAVLAALCVFGIPFAKVLDELSRLSTVPGRMQTLGGQGIKPLVVVDYAHKPDALEKVLQALRLHTKGKLCCVFGCGGERDRGKRPLMAKIAEQWADYVIVTNDNPRHEKPEAIVQEIVQGFLYPERALVELDRSKAIKKSIQWASDKDCVLIAGKGAERYQQIGDEKMPFDDVMQVLECLGSL